METGTTSSSTATAAGQSAAGGKSGGETGLLSSDFETFLRMLTTQMQNQDPLNPVDATDYATQLATFSSVEQQVLTNDLLRDLTEQLAGSAFQALASWIGLEALAEAPVYFNGRPIVLRPEVAAGADSARLVVTDAAGETVQTLTLDPSEPLVAWAGVDAEGDRLASGVYSFTVQSYSEGALIEETAAQVYNPIVEARQDGDRILLTLSDGTEIEASRVSALRSGTA
ncbi:flagellin biosynthesis protein FlgD [Salipiger sp. P9]|uniref:flagellar hook capping FlgD N-terminal domain-containing protein n=1 Tax=Salipiger pentaromativorans TaxID=2943193 RepID=UPI0021573630|nr:flagellar hook capping FlgD N-terminal domain-containing protein [Salipiger pentaromativorans]MCR8549495.1 flagellin biosynthesis protein FlgD [Salipiger pentaromativorans]